MGEIIATELAKFCVQVKLDFEEPNNAEALGSFLGSTLTQISDYASEEGDTRQDLDRLILLSITNSLAVCMNLQNQAKETSAENNTERLLYALSQALTSYTILK